MGRARLRRTYDDGYYLEIGTGSPYTLRGSPTFRPLTDFDVRLSISNLSAPGGAQLVEIEAIPMRGLPASAATGA